MKKVLSLAAMFALSLSLLTATAQDQPKKASVKEAKSGCCASAKAEKASCSTEAKASNVKETKENCDKSKCADECKMAHKTDAKKADNKN